MMFPYCLTLELSGGPNGPESSYAKVDTGVLAALGLELDGRTIAQGGV
jgi:hypothetical protein